ncbi:uncharacterized protein LOC121405337 [Drosophila obscura]|uniref:uncharacterized protein LOC121405337 n=1 Tax=Drosophila obscura TaxID=7282 RepID=UPI001BB2B21B|nr:uncharacterized protein LOC121405337 [Drosophila obscura]
MAEGVVELICEQAALVDSVKRMLEKFKNDETSKSEAHMEARLEAMTTVHAEFRANHRKLIRSEDDLVKPGYLEVDLEGQFEEAYIVCVAQIRTELNISRGRILASTLISSGEVQRNGSTEPTGVSGSAGVEEVKLPRVKLPMFSGEFVDWPAFKDMFEARVHNCPRLTDLHRFHYLKDSLSDEAKRDIQHLTLIESNYSVAWQMLLKLYDNKRVLFQHYMQVLEQQPMVRNDDPVSLKGFLQTCRSCIKSLEKVGVDLTHQSHILVYLMTKKLPAQIRLDWEKSIAQSQELPTFEELSTQLDGQYRTMVTTASADRVLSSNKESKGAAGSGVKRRDVKSSFVARSVDQCAVCGTEGHSIVDCKVFGGMNVTDRRASVMKYRLCFNCLGSNHQSRRCRLKNNCSICTDRHHTLVHVKRQIRDSGDQVQQITSNVINGAPAIGTQKYEVLLPTALVTIESSEGFPLQFRAFLDQGSQASFVSENVAQRLGLCRQKTHLKVNGLSNARITEASSSVLLKIGSRFEPQVKYNVTAWSRMIHLRNWKGCSDGSGSLSSMSKKLEDYRMKNNGVRNIF